MIFRGLALAALLCLCFAACADNAANNTTNTVTPSPPPSAPALDPNFGGKFKKGTAWVTRTDVAMGKVQRVIYDRFEITDMDAGKWYDLRHEMLDENMKPLYGQSAPKPERKYNQAPLPKSGEEVIEEIVAAGRRWRCYRDGSPDSGMAQWRSVDYPGLYVRTQGMVTMELVEFRE